MQNRRSGASRDLGNYSGDAPSPLFSFNHCGPGTSCKDGRTIPLAFGKKLWTFHTRSSRNKSAPHYLRRPSFWTTVL